MWTSPVATSPRSRRRCKARFVGPYSSTNKGGVISSSLEVLAGLAMHDAQYMQLMAIQRDDTIPEFRRLYVEQVISIIQDRADREFQVLWQAHEVTGHPFSSLADRLSAEINQITQAVERSALFNSAKVRHKVLGMYLPPVLLETVGMDQIFARLPEQYQRAIFGRTIASSFVYRCGLEAGFEDYRQYVASLT